MFNGSANGTAINPVYNTNKSRVLANASPLHITVSDYQYFRFMWYKHSWDLISRGDFAQTTQPYLITSNNGIHSNSLIKDWQAN